MMQMQESLGVLESGKQPYTVDVCVSGNAEMEWESGEKAETSQTVGFP